MSSIQNHAADVTFDTFLLSIGTAILIALGEIENPVTKKQEKDLPAAKQNIDILELLAKKTAGNLTEQENRIMSHLLYEMRLKYVAATEKK